MYDHIVCILDCSRYFSISCADRVISLSYMLHATISVVCMEGLLLSCWLTTNNNIAGLKQLELATGQNEYCTKYNRINEYCTKCVE